MSQKEKMVLRSVYLPYSVDRQLRNTAFRSERSKNDVIREIIQAALTERKVTRADPSAKSSKAKVKVNSTPAKVKAPVRKIAKAKTAIKHANKMSVAGTHVREAA